MENFIKKSVFWLFMFMISAVGSRASAQSASEMRALLMFYEYRQLVVTPTRHPKPISQAPQNITVVTARQIEAMNAHTVAEVLARVPGIFVDFFGGDFGSTSFISIQGSEERHVLVLLDEIPWNSLAEGAAETNTIPVAAIDRIEIIKGPASSAWGSSLGGVINIVTKPAGTTPKPQGSFQSSAGLRDTHDYRAQVAGRIGPAGYYLFAGRQGSDGLKDSRFFDNDQLFAKVDLALGPGVTVRGSAGYSEPKNFLGELEKSNLRSRITTHTFFITSGLDAQLTETLNFHAAAHMLRRTTVLKNYLLRSGLTGRAGSLFYAPDLREDLYGGSAQIVWQYYSRHTLVAGLEANLGNLEQKARAGTLLKLVQAPQMEESSPGMDRWAIYANETVNLGRWTVALGLRYDYDTIIGPFFSPGVGLVYRVGDHTVIRCAVARGFTTPALGILKTGGLFVSPNAALEHEEIWSYQAGVESAFSPYLWAKATIFRHDLDRELTARRFGAGPPTYNNVYVNEGETRRTGVELELHSASWHGLSLTAALVFVDISPAREEGTERTYTYGVGLAYDDRESFSARIFGHYIWWDYDPEFEAQYDSFVWDLDAARTIRMQADTALDIFVTAHNIFSASQYTNSDRKNPRRWVEAGIRLRF